MSFYVVITFDLTGAQPQDYTYVQKRLADLKYEKVIKSSKKRRPINLPHNTFVCEFEDDAEIKAKEVKDYVAAELEDIFKRCVVLRGDILFL